ncbi:hypothetical protein ACSSS7_007054 [Eimeria intestinalis]
MRPVVGARPLEVRKRRLGPQGREFAATTEEFKQQQQQQSQQRGVRVPALSLPLGAPQGPRGAPDGSTCRAPSLSLHAHLMGLDRDAPSEPAGAAAAAAVEAVRHPWHAEGTHYEGPMHLCAYRERTSRGSPDVGRKTPWGPQEGVHRAPRALTEALKQQQPTPWQHFFESPHTHKQAAAAAAAATTGGGGGSGPSTPCWGTRLRLNSGSPRKTFPEHGMPFDGEPQQQQQQQQQHGGGGGSRRLNASEATAMRDYTLRLMCYAESLGSEQQQRLAEQQRRGHLTARPLGLSLEPNSKQQQQQQQQEKAFTGAVLSGGRVQSLVQQLESRGRQQGRGGWGPLDPEGPLEGPPGGGPPFADKRGSMTHRPSIGRHGSPVNELHACAGERQLVLQPQTPPYALAHSNTPRLSTIKQQQQQQQRQRGRGASSGSIGERCCWEQQQMVGPTERALRSAKSRGPPDQMVGMYMLGRTVGEGTFGKVKTATHVLTGESVAIKVLEKERLKAPEDSARVLREIHILRVVRHPHIIRLLEVVETASRLYLVMELASGGELFDFVVERQRLDEDTAPCQADAAAAGQQRQQQQQQQHQHQQQVVSPEIVQGKLYSPLAVDIWSCGVILYALLVGRLPFEEETTAALYRSIVGGKIDLPPFLTPEACSLLQGLLNTSPLKRLGPLQIKQHPWLSANREGVVMPMIPRSLTQSRWPAGPPVCCLSDCAACAEWLKPQSPQVRLPAAAAAAVAVDAAVAAVIRGSPPHTWKHRLSAHQAAAAAAAAASAAAGASFCCLKPAPQE